MEPKYESRIFSKSFILSDQTTPYRFRAHASADFSQKATQEIAHLASRKTTLH